MKKFIFCVSLVLSGLMTSCVEKNEEVDADSKPEWLGNSIYQELKNPNPKMLKGTFNTYLRLVDDLGEAETLQRTGSRTVFPANDSAFAEFFKPGGNPWGVTEYEQLSEARKKMLLNSTILENALLLNMLANATNGTDQLVKNRALRHNTIQNVIDTIEVLNGKDEMPQNNVYWKKYYGQKLHVVSDNTTPMMVHFTNEQMVNNSITVDGPESDFAILTGSEYKPGSVYVFDQRVLKGDMTCMNGYIHQLEGVLLTPGNMAQVIKNSDETKYFAHILDYYSAPHYDPATTRNYNDWAVANNRPQIDSIFQVRYFSGRSQGSTDKDAPLTMVKGYSDPASFTLVFDPGWNRYYPAGSSDSKLDYESTDIGAFFVPDDDAVEKFFLNGGGKAIMENYADLPNTKENLMTNLDTVAVRRGDVLNAFVKGLQQKSFVGTTPSKFIDIRDEVSQEYVGLNKSYLSRKANGKYNVKVANNGVVYVINEFITPDEYRSVMYPSSLLPYMSVMNWLVQDGTDNPNANHNVLAQDFRFTLTTMSANFAFFVPDDEAFKSGVYYVDPTSLKSDKPRALKFFIDNKRFYVETYVYDPATNTVGATPDIAKKEINDNNKQYKSQLVDLLNYHTVVLDSTETLCQNGNRYYQTKHGATIRIDGKSQGAQIMSGMQIDNGVEPATISADPYEMKNGNTFHLNHIIQPTVNSVYKTLNDNNDRFSKFIELCGGFRTYSNVLNWSVEHEEKATGSTVTSTPVDRFCVFTNTYQGKIECCLDNNVRFFNTYNYTLYAPDNAAMDEAYAAGLPTWAEINALLPEGYNEAEHVVTAEEEQAMALAYTKICAIRDFIRYHFQSQSLYADQRVDDRRYQTLCTDNVGVPQYIRVARSADKLNVTDGLGQLHVIDASAGNSLLTNKMARDYWFNNSYKGADEIVTSSFCVVHEIAHPFKREADRYDSKWATATAREKAFSAYKQLKKTKKLY